MASTIAFYTGDGTTTDFIVPFDYLAKKFVRVSRGTTILTGGDYGDTSKDYYFLDKNKVRLKVPPATGEEIIIRRYTSTTDRVVSFKDASVLKANDLDVSSVQTIHIAEEARDVINDALLKDKQGNWDAKDKRITNVGAPVADNDAMTYGIYKADALGALQAKIAAEKARDRAIEVETNYKKAEANAKLSEVKSQASAGTAVSASKHADTVKVENQAILQEAKEIRDENKVLDANTKDNANVAQVKANEAKVSEANAKASEVEAKKQADISKQYADQSVAGQLQADWAQTNSTELDFIKNKPTLGTLSAKNSLAYSELTGVPTSFTPSSHTHPISQVTNLQACLDDKTNDATLQVDLTKIRQSITKVSSTIDDIKSDLASFQAQLAQLEGIKHVKETGKSYDGKSWYRKWSDGWLEQGGVAEGLLVSGASATVTLPFAYKDASYSIRGIGVKRRGYYGYAAIDQDSVTRNSFVYAGMGHSSGDGIVLFHWYTCGYIK